MLGHSIRWSAGRVPGPRVSTMRRVLATYDLSARTSLTCDAQDSRLAEFLAKRMDPFVPVMRDRQRTRASFSSGTDPPTRRFIDIQNAARDGTVTASDGEQILHPGRRSCLRGAGFAGGSPAPLRVRAGVSVSRVFARLVRPALHLSLHGHDAVAVHAAAADMDGRAVLVAGWSESGKTETALALMEAGGRFLSDKWTILGSDGEASAFPIDVGVRRWVLQYLPRLRAGLPPGARARLGLAGAAAAVSRPVRERPRPRRAGRLAGRAVALADRAGLPPSQLHSVYGGGDDPARRVPLGAIAILTTVPGGEVTCAPADPAWAAARLALTAAYERRELFGLLDRRRYAFPDPAGSELEEAVELRRGSSSTR